MFVGLASGNWDCLIFKSDYLEIRGGFKIGRWFIVTFDDELESALEVRGLDNLL